MKKLFSVVLIFLLLFLGAGCNEQKETKVTELKTEKEKLGYALGADIGKSFKMNAMDVDFSAFNQGFKDGMADDAKLLLTPEEIKKIQKKAISEMRRNIETKQKVAAEENIQKGAAFFAENAKKEGVTTTESGLQYKILVKGDGPIPVAEDKVKVNYLGTLLDGTEFDNSYKRGKPAEFGVKGVISGWTEALQLMPVGSKWKLFIPGKLAYGPRGAGKLIGANASLIFDVELLEIIPKTAAPKVKVSGPAK